MKIAIVHPYPVHSGAVGGVTRVHALVKHLAQRHEVHVLTHAHDDRDDEESAARESAELGVRQRAFPRGHHSWVSKALWALGRAPYFVGHNRNAALEAALAELGAGGLDAVHLELGYLEPLLHGAGPRCVRVLAEQELMSRSVERLRAVAFRHKTPYQHYISLELPRIRAFEAQSLRRFDLLYGITPDECAQMAALSGRPAAVLPHVVDSRVFAPDPTPQATPERDAGRAPAVIFVGSYTHHPNVEGAFWLMEEVWPAVRRARPDARAVLVGPGLTVEQGRALEALGAELTGRVEDLVGAYRSAALFANPIFSGGGMRGKVLEAFACELPVVSTQRGLEGIEAEPGVHCLRADDTASFASAVLALLSDADRRAALGRAARALVEERYDVRTVLSRLEADVIEAVARKGHGAAREVA